MKKEIRDVLVVISLLLLLIVMLWVLYQAAHNLGVEYGPRPICKRICSSNNAQLIDVRPGTYRNDVCICQDYEGRMSTYTI